MHNEKAGSTIIKTYANKHSHSSDVARSIRKFTAEEHIYMRLNLSLQKKSFGRPNKLEGEIGLELLGQQYHSN